MLSLAFGCVFFNDTATTEIYTLSLHDALPICSLRAAWSWPTSSAEPSGYQPAVTSPGRSSTTSVSVSVATSQTSSRSEEHTSELQSRQYLVCRLLLEKK